MPTTVTPSPWSDQPVTLTAARKWGWFRSAFAVALASSSVSAASTGVDRAALAKAFWQWVGMLESDASFEALDPLDFAHFAAGQLLRCLLQHRPLHLPAEQRRAELRALAGVVLSLLGAWQRALGMAAVAHASLLPDDDSPLWASFVENTAEYPAVAVAFLDHFTGVVPEWQVPQMVAQRPAMLAAMRARRGGDAR